jgi:tetratricopeptide (TPR) repeat protein
MKIDKKIKQTSIASVLVLSLGLTGCTSKEQTEFQEFLNNNQYADAISYYMQNQSKIDSEALESSIKSSIDAIYNAYYAQEMSASLAITNLTTLSSAGVESLTQTIQDKIVLIDKIESSRTAFTQGEELYNIGDYLTAIESYSMVIEEDSNYTVAQERIKASKEAFKSSILETAQSHADNEDYLMAINCLTSALSEVDDTSELESKISEYEQMYKDALLDHAAALAASGDYAGAASYLEGYLNQFDNVSDFEKKIDEYTQAYEDAQVEACLADARASMDISDYYSALVAIQAVEIEYPDNDTVEALRQSAAESYLSNILPLIDSYIEAAQYTDAYSICENALEVVPDSDELAQRLAYIEPLKPVLLSELPISESAEFEQLTEHDTTYKDVVGNVYNPGNLYRIHLYHDGWGSSEDGYAKVYLNAQYSTMVGTLAVDDTSDTGECIISIYADNQVVYTGTFDRTTAPQSISIDVTGKQWIEFRILYPDDTYGYSSNVLLSNVGFYKNGG